MRPIGSRAKRKRKTSPQAMVEVNTTPLIDVMLVLLVMLIVTIPIQLHAIDLDLGAARPLPAQPKPSLVRVAIDAAGVIRIDGQIVSDAAALDARMASLGRQPVQPELRLQVDGPAHYDRVTAVLAAAERHGLQQLGIVAHQP